MFGDYRTVDLPELPVNPHFTEDGERHFRELLSLCAGIRQTGRPVMAMLVPTDRELCCCLLQYEKGAEQRAFQTWIAAGVVRYRWKPTEVLWICDVFTRRFEGIDPQEVEKVANRSLYEDPHATEAFCLLHTRLDCGAVGEVRGCTLPYGLRDNGDLFFRTDDFQDWATMDGPMSMSIMAAVWPLAVESLPPTPLDLNTSEFGIVVFERGNVS